MDFLWPGFLFLLFLIPALIGLYVWILHRRQKYAVHFSSLSIIREALPKYSRIRRHLPFALFLLALLSLIIALSKPATITTIPTNQTTIILAIDVSGSMRSRDIQPDRLIAAETAALNFIQKQKSSTQIGIVAFSGFAEEIQSPTTDQEALQAAIQSLTVGRRTAIGAGILKSIDAIAEIDKSVPPSIDETSNTPEPPPVPKGYYAPDIIVLLTDGASNAGILPTDAAQQAADRGIRVYTIGYGTENGVMPFGAFGGQSGGGGNLPFGGQQPGGNGFGGGFGGGFRTPIDEDALKQIASITGGIYYKAQSANELQSVFQKLPTYLISKHEVVEISVLFTAIGALFAVAAVGLALMWRPLP